MRGNCWFPLILKKEVSVRGKLRCPLTQLHRLLLLLFFFLGFLGFILRALHLGLPRLLRPVRLTVGHDPNSFKNICGVPSRAMDRRQPLSPDTATVRAGGICNGRDRLFPKSKEASNHDRSSNPRQRAHETVHMADAPRTGARFK